MLARELPGVVVAVGPRRDVVGRAVERRFGRRVHVLDDGFQHLRLARALDIVCLDAADLTDRPLPAGRLREHPTSRGRAGVRARGWAGRFRRFTLCDCPGTARSRSGRSVSGAQAAGFVSPTWRERGSASPSLPSRCHRATRAVPRRRPAAVGSVAGMAFFRDHHAFSPAELTGLGAGAGPRAPMPSSRRPRTSNALDPGGLRLPLRRVPHAGRGRRHAPLPRRSLARCRREGRVKRRPDTGSRLQPWPWWRPSRGSCRAARCFALGETLGRRWAAIDGRHRRIAADNIRRAFPEWDETRVLATARGVYVHFATTLLDILWMERRSVERDAGPRPTRRGVSTSMLWTRRGAERSFRRATSATGSSRASPSRRSWRPVGVIVRPLDNPLLDARLDAFRTKGGNVILSKRRALPTSYESFAAAAESPCSSTRTSRRRTASSWTSSAALPARRRWPRPSR